MAATDNSKFLSKTQYEVTLQRLAQVTGRTLGADSNNAFKADLSSSDRVLGSWTHPTATATTIAAASGKVLSAITVDSYGHVTSVSSKTLAAADLPTVTVAKGGTGLTTWTGAYRIIYSTAATTVTTLAPNTTATKKFLSMTGTGSAGAAPTWSALAASDIPNLDWSKITSGKPTTLSGYGITDAKIEDNTSAFSGTKTITLGSVSINIAPWAQSTTNKIASSALPALYIGTTAVSATSGSVTNLAGVTTFTPASGHTLSYESDDEWWAFSDTVTAPNLMSSGSVMVGTNIMFSGNLTSYMYWDSTNSAWHLAGNLIADGYVSAGGMSAQGGGGGGSSDLYVVTSWSSLDISDGDQVLGSVLGQDINTRLTALETSATNVSFTQTLTSGKQIGTITIDGTSTNLYAPGTYALSDITGADDLKAIEDLTGTSGALVKTAANTWSLKSISDSSSAGALSSSSTNFVTERDVYYGLPKINNAHTYTSSSAYYAPTTGGTSGYILKANGSTSAPTWATVDSLMGDYAKTTAVTQAIADAIAGVTSFEYSVVTSLPTTGVKGTIYLVAHTHGTQDIYDEYIWVGDKYEKIGNTDIDLSGYWATTDLVAITATENTTLLNSYFPVS